MRNLSNRLLLATLVCAATALWVGTRVQGAAAEDVAASNIDLSVPESPAFAVLGLTPQSVTRPASTADIATSLLNGVDDNGNLQTGLAIDFKPYSYWYGNQVDIKKYRGYKPGDDKPDRWNGTRFLNRAEVSVATAKGVTDDDKRTRVAAGLHLTPWDRGDPHMDTKTSECFFDEKQGAPQQLRRKPESLMSEEEKEEWPNKVHAYEERLQAHAAQCREQAKHRAWNRSSWGVSLAPAWGSKSGSTNDLKWDGFGAWTSVAYGFEDLRTEGDPITDWLLYQHTQLIVHARYRDNELIADPNTKGAFFREDTVATGGRLRVGTGNGGLSAELLYIRDMPHDKTRAAKDDYRAAIAAEIRLSSQLWLEVSAGQKGPPTAGAKSQGFVLSSLKWGFSKESKNVSQ